MNGLPTTGTTGVERDEAPMVSVVTASFRAGEALKATAASVHAQTRKVEWIIADGGSQDGTVEVIRTVCKPDVWFSEPDRGIYDAFNKGCRRARGRWVIFLGAGDCFHDPDVVEDFCRHVASLPEGTLLVHGAVAVTGPDGGVAEILDSGSLVAAGAWESGRPAMPHHQGVFHHASILMGEPFDIRYRIAADGKLLIPHLLRGEASHFPRVVARADLGGVSTEPRTAWATAKEIRRINVELGLAWTRLPAQLVFQSRCWLKSWLAGWIPERRLKSWIDLYRVATRRGAKWKT